MMQRDNRKALTVLAPGRSRDQQLRVTGVEEISRHTCTCVFPGERITVVHVIGGESQDEARTAVLAAWQPCRYTVQDGDLSGGHAAPFVLRLPGAVSVKHEESNERSLAPLVVLEGGQNDVTV